MRSRAAKKLLAEADIERFTVGMQCPNGRYVYDEQICLPSSHARPRRHKVTPQFNPPPSGT
jgi:peptide/nickel transport system substrate-binding protein